MGPLIRVAAQSPAAPLRILKQIKHIANISQAENQKSYRHTPLR